MLETAVWITQVLLAVGALCAVYRVYKGPSVLDRVISVDVILVIVASVMLVEMVRSDHQDFILFVVVTSVIGFLGAVAIARYVVARKPEDAERAAEREAQAAGMGVPEPEAPQNVADAPVMTALPPQQEDESTSWFTALAKSGFVPKRGSGAGSESGSGSSGSDESGGEGSGDGSGEGSTEGFGDGSSERPKGER